MIAAGWRGAVGWLPELVYGVAPNSQQYNWVGAVQNVKGTIDKQPIFVYRMDGSTDFPAYLLEGQRNVDLVITYWPQDIALLLDDINNLGLDTTSHSFIVRNFDTGATYTITGCVANQVQVTGKTGQALEIQVTYWCQNIMSGLPTGSFFSVDPGNVPFFFAQESVQVPSGTPQPETLTFTGTITNNLSRVPQFGTDVIRSIPTLTRKADGTLTATFSNLFDFPNEGNIPNIQGTTTGATATLLTDTTAFFTDSALIGGLLTYMTGPAAGQRQIITANTFDTISTAAFSPAPSASGDVYVVNVETAPSGLSQQEISLLLGVNGATSYYLNYTGAVIPKIDLTNPIADLTALSLDWTATGANVGTTI